MKYLLYYIDFTFVRNSFPNNMKGTEIKPTMLLKPPYTIYFSPVIM